MPIDPLATDQVEVIRGPATLRYGSQSIGGVVSATNNRIPEALPCCRAPFQSYGMPAKRRWRRNVALRDAETRTAVSSVDRGLEGGVLLDAGGGNVAVHADAFGRKADDYRVPRYPYLFDPTRPFNGTQPNSAARSRRRIDRRLLHFPWRLHRRRGHAEQRALSHPRHRRRRSPDPHRRAADQVHRQGRISPGCGGHRSGALLGRRDRLQAQRDRACRSGRSVHRRRAADLHQQGAGRPRRGAARAVRLCASPR